MVGFLLVWDIYAIQSLLPQYFLARDPPEYSRLETRYVFLYARRVGQVIKTSLTRKAISSQIFRF